MQNGYVFPKQFSILISTDIQGLPVDYSTDVKSPASTTSKVNF